MHPVFRTMCIVEKPPTATTTTTTTALTAMSRRVATIPPPPRQRRRPSLKETPSSTPSSNRQFSKSNTGRIVSYRIRLPGGQSKKVTRQRTIEFNEQARVKRVPSQFQLCGEENADELWFQPDEYEAISEQNWALVRTVQEDSATDGDGNGGDGDNAKNKKKRCTRGLEQHFSFEETQEKQQAAWDLVLKMQELQRSRRDSYDGGERLSKAYGKFARRCVSEARERAELDRQDAKKYLKKTRTKVQRTRSMPATPTADRQDAKTYLKKTRTKVQRTRSMPDTPTATGGGLRGANAAGPIKPKRRHVSVAPHAIIDDEGIKVSSEMMIYRAKEKALETGLGRTSCPRRGAIPAREKESSFAKSRNKSQSGGVG